MSLLEKLKDSIVNTNPGAAKELTERALSEGYEAKTILDDSLIPGMDEVGRLFKEGDYFVPEVLVAAKAMHASMDIIEPLLVKGGVKKVGKVIAGTIDGDLHDIGKNLVCMMLKGAGFEVVDLGVDVKPEAFVKAVKEEKPEFLLISALLTSTMINMPNVIKALENEGLKDKVKVIIGGAPVSESYAKEIGADGYSEDSTGAVELLRKLVKK
jgi:corrinoid protein of di/trimethylamine methyltransferase